MNVDDVLNIDYRFSFDPMSNDAPEVFKTQDTLLRFSYAELYKLRMFVTMKSFLLTLAFIFFAKISLCHASGLIVISGSVTICPTSNDTLQKYIEHAYSDIRSFQKQKSVDRKYLSKEFYGLIQRERNDGDVTFNYWVQDDEWNKPTFKVGQVERLSLSRANVKVAINNGGDKSHVVAKLILENGCWKFDDFVNEFGSCKASLRLLFGIPTKLTGTLSGYSLSFQRNDAANSSQLIVSFNGRCLSRIAFDVYDVKNFSVNGIEAVPGGIRIYISYGGGNHMYNRVFRFTYRGKSFYLVSIKAGMSYYSHSGYGYRWKTHTLPEPVELSKFRIRRFIVNGIDKINR